VGACTVLVEDAAFVVTTWLQARKGKNITTSEGIAQAAARCTDETGVIDHERFNAGKHAGQIYPLWLDVDEGHANRMHPRVYELEIVPLRRIPNHR